MKLKEIEKGPCRLLYVGSRALTSAKYLDLVDVGEFTPSHVLNHQHEKGDHEHRLTISRIARFVNRLH
jgi:hypothetical protein